MNNHPIGIFDSGIGGLTVLRAVRAALPYESVLYLGDTARLPYGNKSGETVTRFSLENSAFLAARGIKLLIVACNTASAYALECLQKTLPVPVIGVIRPSVAAGVASTATKHIAVLGTRGTIHSGAYQREILQLLPEATLYPVACPLFVPLVEEAFTAHPVARLVVEEYLGPLRGTPVDTVILGCTHYPLLRILIQETLGSHVTIVDSAGSCAAAIKKQLEDGETRSDQRPVVEHFLVTDDPDSFRRLGSQVLGRQLSHVELVANHEG